MILKRISILNYKNLEEVELAFSPKLNSFFGQNGMGKTNLLDAIYFLSFCKSAGNPIDSQNIRHDADFFVIQGFYEGSDGTPEEIYCGMKRSRKKQFKRNKKEYGRFSDHIGFLPLVMVSPADADLIGGGSDERRRFMDVVISQYDKEYLDALIRYNKAMAQRNALLKSESAVDNELFGVWEEMMAQAGEVVYRKRETFINDFVPIFRSFYAFISQDKEQVGLAYESHARDASLLDILKQSRERDRVMGYSLRGIHKDELNMLLGDFPIKKEGSQGQNKTYLVALKLAQFDFLKRTGKTVPLLLLDDLFDKLDASRVEQIIKVVGGDGFGQIFITDTNREHLDRIL
uniref:DNA replication/repair protein RecF n=1 Tax=Prevotella heparinolytica TaxID=28113 RepID=UPI00359F4732